MATTINKLENDLLSYIIFLSGNPRSSFQVCKKWREAKDLFIERIINTDNNNILVSPAQMFQYHIQVIESSVSLIPKINSFREILQIERNSKDNLKPNISEKKAMALINKISVEATNNSPNVVDEVRKELNINEKPSEERVFFAIDKFIQNYNAILASCKQQIVENTSYLEKLCALKKIVELDARLISKDYGKLPHCLQNAIAYRIHEWLCKTNASETNGRTLIEKNPENMYVKQAVREIFALHPSNVFVLYKALAVDKKASVKDRAKALVELIKLDRKPYVYNPSTKEKFFIALEDDISPKNQKEEIKDVFFYQMQDIEGDFRIHVRRKLWEDGGYKKSGEEIFEQDPLSSAVVQAIRSVIGGYRAPA